ncbi:MAG: peptidoglycan-binding domain-containing protein [Candidatus Adlerbacteria bacterium]|nr:peptidoglycan-binding domain-containing protein [Candidatus Adlerbacteria bacterium]
MKNKLTVLAASISMLALAAPALAATISTQMDIGSRGSDVTTLQQTFAGDASLYPEGLVTGYFGSLSAAAVKRFQANNGIVSSGSAASTGYGRVGPSTIAKFNAVYGSGTSADDMAPFLSSVAVAPTNSGTTLLWNSNEPVTSIVYYSTSPLTLHEVMSGAPGVTGNNVLSMSASLNSSNSVQLSNLSSHTTYYYVVVATDTSGNVSITLPSTFTTN